VTETNQGHNGVWTGKVRGKSGPGAEARANPTRIGVGGGEKRRRDKCWEYGGTGKERGDVGNRRD